MLIDPSDVPVTGAFYQHRSKLYIAKVTDLTPHLTLGYLVRLQTFHGPYPRTLTLNPVLFRKLFTRV